MLVCAWIVCITTTTLVYRAGIADAQTVDDEVFTLHSYSSDSGALGFLAMAEVQGDVILGGYIGTDALLVRATVDGDIGWARRFAIPDGGNDTRSELGAVTIGGDDEVYVAGTLTLGGDQPAEQFVGRFSSDDGSVSWLKRHQSADMTAFVGLSPGVISQTRADSTLLIGGRAIRLDDDVRYLVPSMFRLSSADGTLLRAQVVDNDDDTSDLSFEDALLVEQLDEDSMLVVALGSKYVGCTTNFRADIECYMLLLLSNDGMDISRARGLARMRAAAAAGGLSRAALSDDRQTLALAIATPKSTDDGQNTFFDEISVFTIDVATFDILSNATFSLGESYFEVHSLAFTDADQGPGLLLGGAFSPNPNNVIGNRAPSNTSAFLMTVSIVDEQLSLANFTLLSGPSPGVGLASCNSVLHSQTSTSASSMPYLLAGDMPTGVTNDSNGLFGSIRQNLYMHPSCELGYSGGVAELDFSTRSAELWLVTEGESFVLDLTNATDDLESFAYTIDITASVDSLDITGTVAVRDALLDDALACRDPPFLPAPTPVPASPTPTEVPTSLGPSPTPTAAPTMSPTPYVPPICRSVTNVTLGENLTISDTDTCIEVYPPDVRVYRVSVDAFESCLDVCNEEHSLIVRNNFTVATSLELPLYLVAASSRDQNTTCMPPFRDCLSGSRSVVSFDEDGGGGGVAPIQTDGPSDQCTTNNLRAVAVVVIVVLLAFIFIMVIAIRVHSRDARSSDFITFSLTLFDVITDAIFIVSISTVDEFRTYFLIGLICILLSIVINMAIVVGFINRMTTNKDFREYFYKHHPSVISVLLLSLSNVDSVIILNSQIFGLQFLSAPWNRAAENFLIRNGLWGNLLEDIPQLVIQRIVISNAMNCSSIEAFTIISFTASLLALGFGIMKRILFFFLWRNDNEINSDSTVPALLRRRQAPASDWDLSYGQNTNNHTHNSPEAMHHASMNGTYAPADYPLEGVDEGVHRGATTADGYDLEYDTFDDRYPTNGNGGMQSHRTMPRPNGTITHDDPFDDNAYPDPNPHINPEGIGHGEQHAPQAVEAGAAFGPNNPHHEPYDPQFR